MENTQRKIDYIIATHVSEPFPEVRLIESHEELLYIVTVLREKGFKVCFTVGVYDMYHVGHVRYLRKAKRQGYIVLVGIDTDEFTRLRKGPSRPIVPYDERWDVVSDSRSVDIVTPLDSSEENRSLLENLRPDVMLLSFSSTKDDFEGYAKRMHDKYDPFCAKVEILERQAETSTSARISQIVLDGGKNLTEKVQECCNILMEASKDFFTSAKGGE
jgi:cytidyltransferase-like protein